MGPSYKTGINQLEKPHLVDTRIMLSKHHVFIMQKVQGWRHMEMEVYPKVHTHPCYFFRSEQCWHRGISEDRHCQDKHSKFTNVSSVLIKTKADLQRASSDTARSFVLKECSSSARVDKGSYTASGVETWPRLEP